jgi:hypothetical protein
MINFLREGFSVILSQDKVDLSERRNDLAFGFFAGGVAGPGSRITDHSQLHSPDNPGLSLEERTGNQPVFYHHIPCRGPYLDRVWPVFQSPAGNLMEYDYRGPDHLPFDRQIKIRQTSREMSSEENPEQISLPKRQKRLINVNRSIQNPGK